MLRNLLRVYPRIDPQTNYLTIHDLTLRLMASKRWRHSVFQFLPVMLVEALGSFVLVFTVALTAHQPLGPIAIGTILIAMIYAGAEISGAHYNPAVTLGLYISWKTKLTWKLVCLYICSQLAGSLLAGIVGEVIAQLTISPTPTLEPNEDMLAHHFHIFSGELIFTFILVFVILQVSVYRSINEVQYHGIAIGATVLSGILTLRETTGSVFNPGVAIGTIFAHWTFGSGNINDVWIYVTSPTLGGVLAGAFSRLLHSLIMMNGRLVKKQQEETINTTDPESDHCSQSESRSSYEFKELSV